MSKINIPFNISPYLGESLLRHGANTSTTADNTNAFRSLFAAIDPLNGGSGIAYIPPGTWYVDYTNNGLFIPDGCCVYGTKGQSIIKAQPNTLGITGSSSSVKGGALLFAGRASAVNGNTANTRAGYVASHAGYGTGLTISVTTDSNGSVPGNPYEIASIVSIINPGSGYIVNDTVYFANGATATVTAISGAVAGRGSVSALTLVNKGGSVADLSSSDKSSYPSTSTSSTGAEYYVWGDVFNSIQIHNLVLDGNCSSSTNLITNSGAGINLGVCRDVSLSGLEIRNTPSSGIASFGCSRWRVNDIYAHDCGTYGAAGAARNGIDIHGLYSLTDPSLITHTARITNITTENNMDVGIEFTKVKNMIISGVTMKGDGRSGGGIAIEGEAASFQVIDTSASNGGYEIPSSIVITDFIIDGNPNNTSANGSTTATKYNQDGISIGSGNEGIIKISNGVIRNFLRYGVLGTQATGGQVEINDVYIENVGGSNAYQTMFFQVDNIRIDNVKIRNCTNSSAIMLGSRCVTGRFRNIDIDNHVGTSNTIYLNAIAGNGVDILEFDNINFENNSNPVDILLYIGDASSNLFNAKQVIFNNIRSRTNARTVTNGAQIKLAANGSSAGLINYLSIVNCSAIEDVLKTTNQFNSSIQVVEADIFNNNWKQSGSTLNGGGGTFGQLRSFNIPGVGNQVYYGSSSKPTSGFYKAGDMILATPQAASGRICYTCTVTGYAGATWTTGATKYIMTSYVVPSVANGYVYQATAVSGTLTTGVTGATEPTWPTTIGSTITDNTITWTCVGVVATFVSGPNNAAS